MVKSVCACYPLKVQLALWRVSQLVGSPHNTLFTHCVFIINAPPTCLVALEIVIFSSANDIEFVMGAQGRKVD